MDDNSCTDSFDHPAAALSDIYTQIEPWQIRVLQLLPGREDELLCGELVVCDLPNSDKSSVGEKSPTIKYEALSYVWGAPKFRISVQLGQTIVKVTPTLADALKRLRYSNKPRWIWCDALCINQSNKVEKSYQVQRMFDIYGAARRVVVWLGHAGPDTEVAIRYLSMNHEEQMVIDKHQEKMRAADMFVAKGPMAECVHAYRIGVGFWDLCSRPWFRCVWIQQEVFAARSVRVYLGNFRLRLSEFRRCLDYARSLTKDDIHGQWERHKRFCPELEPEVSRILSLGPSNEDRKNSEDLDALFMRMRLADVELRTRLRQQNKEEYITRCGCTAIYGNGDQQLLEKPECVLSVYRNLHATHTVDHVYGLLGMMDCNVDTTRHSPLPDAPDIEDRKPVLHVDYAKSAYRVFQDLTKYILNRDRSMRVLCQYKGERHHRPDGLKERLELPSWCPDWRYPNFEHRSSYYIHKSMDRLVFKLPWQDDNEVGSLTLLAIEVAKLVAVNFDKVQLETPSFREITRRSSPGYGTYIELLQDKSHFKVIDLVDHDEDWTDLGWSKEDLELGQSLLRTTTWRVSPEHEISAFEDLSLRFDVKNLTTGDTVVRDGKCWKNEGQIDEFVILRPSGQEAFCYVGHASLFRALKGGPNTVYAQDALHDHRLRTFKVY